MKKFSIPAVAALIISVVIAVGSVSFLSPCIHEDGSFGVCHWAGQALLGTGVLMAVLSLLALIIPDHGIRSGLFLSVIASAVLGMLIPGTLIDLCHMATMRCRAVMRPAMIILCLFAAVFAIVGLILEQRKGKNRESA